MTTDLLSSLNPEQKLAVTHGDGPLLILAGAGSGKTRCLTYRVAWLMSERLVDPDKILLLTFTNKAAGEMKTRVTSLLSAHHPSTINHQPFPFSGTFHSWCAWILRKHASRAGLKPEWLIYDEEDRRQLIKEIISDDPDFDKTEVLVRLYRIGTVYVSRSQARRILTGLEKFRQIVLEFDRVPTVGQAFADEIFRVFGQKYPKITIVPVNMNKAVKYMVERAGWVA